MSRILCDFICGFRSNSHIPPVTMASVQSSIINLTKTIIGAGLLAIPFAFKADGIALGILLILIAGLTSSYGLYIISRVSTLVQGETSFFKLCSITYPKLTLLFDFSIALQTFGVAISYLILFGDLVPSLINNVLTREQVILLSLVIIIPLISLRKLDSLKIGSLIGLIAIGFLTVLVISHSVVDDYSQTRKGELRIWSIGSTSKVLSTFSIIIFAYTAAQNICTIINEISNPIDLNLVILTSVGISTVLFIVVGISGYLEFGDAVTGNVILEYDPTLLSSKIGRFALTLMVALSYPLMFHPCRISINNMIHWIELEVKNHESTPLLTNNNPDDNQRDVPFSNKRFVLITIGLTLVTYGLALSISSFELVLSLVGATGSTLICFILPGLFGYKLFEKQIEKNLSISLTVWGIAVMVTSVFATLYYK